MDKLTALSVFRRVAEVESFSGAARALGLSNAAVSKNVRELEEQLGTRLIHRTTRRMHLTAAGEAYYQRTAAILDELQHADATITDLGSGPRGRLRVAAPMSFGLTHFASAIGSFVSRYPELQIDLQLNDRYVDLVQEGYDLAVRGAGVLPDSSLAVRKLGAIERCVVASTSYLAQYGEPRKLDDLCRHRCLVYSLSSSPKRWTFLKGQRKRSVEVRGTLEINNSLALVRAAAAGAGLALVPTSFVRQELEEGSLRRVLTSFACEAQALYALYPKHRQRSQALRLLLDDLAASVGRGG